MRNRSDYRKNVNMINIYNRIAISIVKKNPNKLMKKIHFNL